MRTSGGQAAWQRITAARTVRCSVSSTWTTTRASLAANSAMSMALCGISLTSTLLCQRVARKVLCSSLPQHPSQASSSCRFLTRLTMLNFVAPKFAAMQMRSRSHMHPLSGRNWLPALLSALRPFLLFPLRRS
eukprot:Rmarinus@m.29863